MKKKIIIVIALFTITSVLSLGAMFFLRKTPDAEAGSSHNVKGWVWAEAYVDQNGNGIEDPAETALGSQNGGSGWISLNSLNCDPDGDGQYEAIPESVRLYQNCPKSGIAYDYGVSASGQPGDRYRNLTGYAWSDNYGWIGFGTAAAGAGYPTGAGLTPVAARINNNNTPTLDDDYIEGWARVVSQRTGLSKKTGDWSGWISLGKASTTASPITYRVMARSSNPGWSWGSSLMGWMQWQLFDTNPDMCSNLDGIQNTVQDPYVRNVDGTCTIPTPVYPAQCVNTQQNGCGMGNTVITNSPANTGTTLRWTCRGSGSNPVPAEDTTCSYPCPAGQIIQGEVCVASSTPLAAGGYDLIPRFVNSPSETCRLSNWRLTSLGVGQVNCQINGGADIPYTGTNSTNLTVGTHTLTCRDSSPVPQTVRFNPDPVCRRSPGYGEF